MIGDEKDRQQIFGSLADVGSAKVGYLPLNTLTKHLSMDMAEIVNSFEQRGLRTKVFLEDQCCINGGALYVYDPIALQRVLSVASGVLERNGWPVVADSFVEEIAKSWIDQTDPVYPVIQRAFGGS